MHFIASEVYCQLGVFNYTNRLGATVQSGLLRLAQERNQWQDLLNIIMNSVVTQKAENILIS
jgi:hypothetical protein